MMNRPRPWIRWYRTPVCQTDSSSGVTRRLRPVSYTHLGPDGISGIPKPTVFGLEMTRRASTEGGTTFHDFFGLTFQNQHMVIYLYMMALLLALVTLFVSTRLIRMTVGRAWEALREDEICLLYTSRCV